MYLVAASTLGQLTLAFAPTLSSLLDRGRPGELAEWSARLLKCLAAGGVIMIFGAWFLAELVVPLVFGAVYHPVVPNLVTLSLAVLTLTIGNVSSVLALVHERPRVPLFAAAIRLALFWSLGPLLVGRWASLGGCVAVVTASTVHAGYLAWRMRDVGGAGQLRAWLVPVAVGALFLPLAWLRSASPWDAALYLAFIVGYPAVLLGLRVVTRQELAAFVSLFRGPGGLAQEPRPVRRR
jgi:O-antigen/teichoic acid export membrane protein